MAKVILWFAIGSNSNKSQTTWKPGTYLYDIKSATKNSAHFVLCCEQMLHGLMAGITAITEYRFFDR